MVNRKRNYTLYFLLYSALVLIALSATNYLGMEHRARLDLTADKRFTLSDGTLALLDKLPDNISVTYYVNAEPPPARVNLERDVRDKLQELAKASGGKLGYNVVRIEQSQMGSKAEELKSEGLSLTNDIQTTGEEEKTRVTGVTGYFSSLLVRYGTGKEAINGVVNVNSKDDAAREHRVESIEFDIMFAVLRMKSQQVKKPLKQMLRDLKSPVQLSFLYSEQMPRDNPQLAENILKALERLRGYAPQNVEVSSRMIPWGMVMREVMPTETLEPTVDPKDSKSSAPPGAPPGERDGDETGDASPDKPAGTPPGGAIDPSKQPGGVTPPGGGTEPNPDTPAKPEPRQGPFYYYTYLGLSSIGAGFPFTEFGPDKDVDAIERRLDGLIWELVKPRTTLGIVAPEVPGDPRMGGGGSPYQAVSQHIINSLQYSGRMLNLQADKRVPRDLAVLLVFEPGTLSERELYEIDRYLAEGGNVVMMHQAFSTDLHIATANSTDVPLKPIAAKPHFLDWCKHQGVSFGSDLLIQPGGYYMQAVMGGGRNTAQQPMSLPLAADVGTEDTDQSSIFSRMLSGMPLPLPVELKADENRLAELKLSRQDVIRLSGDIYRFIPEDRAMPRIPRVGLTLQSRAEREEDPSVAPGKDVRLQRLANAPLIATVLSGSFTSYWSGGNKLVPRWEGSGAEKADLGGQPVPAVTQRPGRLFVVSCAASFNSEYFDSWTEKDIKPLLFGGLNFYKNVAEAGIYGEELVGLRAKTGAAPRISGNVSKNDRITWYLICLAGAPVTLLLVGFMRGAYRAKAREEYRLKLESTDQ